MPLTPPRSHPSAWSYVLGSIPILLAVAALLRHAEECLSRFPPGRPGENSLPFTDGDHVFHFYYSHLTTEFFRTRHSFWGYDPTFMAGYGKTLIFPTSSTLPELVAICCGGPSGFTYRLFVVATLFFTPILLGLAARSLTRGWGAFVFALCLGVIWVWCGFPTNYVIWGMAPFIIASAASIWSGVLLADWLDHPSRRLLFTGGLIAALATIAHPSSPVILALLLLPGYVSKARSLNWRSHLTAWAVPIVIVLAWSPWWFPAVVLRDTYRTTATGFVNENILGRIGELANARFPEETALIVAGLASCAGLHRFNLARTWCLIGAALILLVAALGSILQWWHVVVPHNWPGIAGLVLFAVAVLFGMIRAGPATTWSLVAGALALFGIAYFGGGVQWLWALQPGRYTQPLYGLLIVLIASGISRLLGQISTRTWSHAQWAALAALLVAAGSCWLVLPKGYNYLQSQRGQWLHTDLPPQLNELAEHLRQSTDSSGRILFEDRGKVSLGRLDPFQGTNPSALLPLLAPGQYIGGPYLYTHLKTNFTQFGDDYFFGHPVQSLDRATFERYSRLYNIRWAVFRSGPMTRLALKNPDLFVEQARFGFMRVYELRREPNWAIAGTAHVNASPDRLEVSDAKPDEQGSLILSYHWVCTLHSSIPLRPELREDDPVPFIAVDDPPRDFAIECRLW